ncbi:hypothetical protein CXF72_03950 [Psychromonas sp. MB-3u-54]|uniref:hypothetical protein n=1 Tax=Psychromonas sp. MB-3u-54 TaxID=2058319 RepID=UPI000C337697|nr:hypothetical protein [Psychromonas sp. MB-3u-54]PKH03863.1 hypothetical protein CXF72_03950 [Psychromonas sp. MB-3u-54]
MIHMTKDPMEKFFTYPSYSEQLRITEKIDELMLLYDQLKQQTESGIDVHKTLVEVLLTTFTDSKNHKELNKNWAQVSEFSISFLQQSTVSIS